MTAVGNLEREKHGNIPGPSPPLLIPPIPERVGGGDNRIMIYYNVIIILQSFMFPVI
jgi:hypothetical protein